MKKLRQNKSPEIIQLRDHLLSFAFPRKKKSGIVKPEDLLAWKGSTNDDGETERETESEMNRN